MSDNKTRVITVDSDQWLNTIAGLFLRNSEISHRTGAHIFHFSCQPTVSLTLKGALWRCALRCSVVGNQREMVQRKSSHLRSRICVYVLLPGLRATERHWHVVQPHSTGILHTGVAPPFGLINKRIRFPYRVSHSFRFVASPVVFYVLIFV